MKSQGENRDISPDSKIGNWCCMGLFFFFYGVIPSRQPTFHSIDGNIRIGETYFLFFYRFSITSVVKFPHYGPQSLFVLVMNFPPASTKKRSCQAADFFK